MTIDRRDFVTGIALTAVAPTLSLFSQLYLRHLLRN